MINDLIGHHLEGVLGFILNHAYIHILRGKLFGNGQFNIFFQG